MLTKVAPTGPNIIVGIQKELFSDSGEPISAWLGSRPKPLVISSIHSSLIRPNKSVIASTPKKTTDSDFTMDCVTCPKCSHVFNIRNGLKRDKPIPSQVEQKVSNAQEVDLTHAESQKSILNQKSQNIAIHQSTDSLASGARTGRFTRIYEARTNSAVNKELLEGTLQSNTFKQGITEDIIRTQKRVDRTSSRNQSPQEVTAERRIVDENQKKGDKSIPQSLGMQKTSADVFSDQKITDQIDSQNRIDQQILRVPSYWNETERSDVPLQEARILDNNNNNEDSDEISAEMKLAEIAERRKTAERKIIYQARNLPKPELKKGVISVSALSEESVSTFTSDTSSSLYSTGNLVLPFQNNLYILASSKARPPDDYYVDLGIEKAPRFNENPCSSNMHYDIELKNPIFLCSEPADLFLTNRNF